MGILDWFRRRRTRPIIADAKGKSPYEQAKEILSQSEGKEDVLSTKMKEATIKLDKFETTSAIKEVPKRARTKKGRYQADDKSTPDVNEAWSGGKAPVKKAKPKKKTVEIRRTTKKK
tara:strand:+ start:193 stop:543 length:351 start_codon:yes stop_codon:yes gene_type:complete